MANLSGNNHDRVTTPTKTKTRTTTKRSTIFAHFWLTDKLVLRQIIVHSLHHKTHSQRSTLHYSICIRISMKDSLISALTLSMLSPIWPERRQGSNGMHAQLFGREMTLHFSYLESCWIIHFLSLVEISPSYYWFNQFVCKVLWVEGAHYNDVVWPWVLINAVQKR